ncbi:MerP [Hymenobacter sp. DG25B]|uniref:heavy-metal-associated domain-containing protein n=1 Tax=Hymenobacter sp. DG25B TaxID=1385664 RepID=UPI000540A6F2|nr:heavy-metal-associated domain-containing protein [Hymenobacter sp. DG25B]AIZ65070.1 MerP [Hymenobacter sp. DG25B]
MKSIKALLLTLVVLFSAQLTQAQEKTKTKTKGPATEQLQIKTSAVCDMCKARLEKSMAYEKGVQAAVLDVPSKILTVTYRPDKTSAEALRTAVQSTGYDADAQMANDKAYERLPDCCKKTNSTH